MIVSVFILLALATVIEAYLDVNSRPTVPMFWCSTCQTFFKMEHCLPLFPDMGGTAQNSYVCPTCYYKAVYTDPNKKLRT